MECHIITLFPQIVSSYLDESIMKRAHEKGLFRSFIHNLADWSVRNTRRADDKPYGGGAGTILMIEPLYNLIQDIESTHGTMRKIYFSPRGETMNQQDIEKDTVSDEKYLIICGHYEGIDERIFELFEIEEISIGNYVLSSGELAGLVWLDAHIRFIPGVIDAASLEEESFSPKLLGKKEYPQYTRPAVFQGYSVPEVLLSGDHKNIQDWKMNQLRD